MPNLEPLGDFAFELAHRLTEEYGEDFRLGEVFVIAEIVLPDESTRVEVLSSEPRAYVAAAILNRALDVVGEREEAELEREEE